MEACEGKRNKYQKVIKDIPTQRVVYIDDSGIEMGIHKEKSYSLKVKAVLAKKSEKYYEGTNIIAGLVNNKSIAPMVFNGSCNTKVFNSWVENVLIKELKPRQFDEHYLLLSFFCFVRRFFTTFLRKCEFVSFLQFESTIILVNPISITLPFSMLCIISAFYNGLKDLAMPWKKVDKTDPQGTH